MFGVEVEGKCCKLGLCLDVIWRKLGEDREEGVGYVDVFGGGCDYSNFVKLEEWSLGI